MARLTYREYLSPVLKDLRKVLKQIRGDCNFDEEDVAAFENAIGSW